MTEYIEHLRESDIAGLLYQLENDALTKGADVFIDNSSLMWPINHLNKANSIKRIDYTYLRKSNQFYHGLNRLIETYGKNTPLGGSEGKLHVIPAIGTELKKSAGATQGIANNLLASYEEATEEVKANLSEHDAQTVLQELSQVMGAFHTYASKIVREGGSSEIIDSLGDLLFEAKKHFHWRNTIGDKDLCLIAAAFEKAIRVENDVYIVAEDKPITFASESLYKLLVCKQTGISQNVLDRILPLGLFVWRTDGDTSFHPKFNSYVFPPGTHFGMKEQFRDHYSRGTKLGTSAVLDAEEKLLKKAYKVVHSWLKHLPKPAKEESAAANLDELAEELTELDEPAPAKQEEAAEASTPAPETPEEPRKTIERLQMYEFLNSRSAIESTVEGNMEASFAIISKYADLVYAVTPEETPAKEQVMVALAELARSSETDELREAIVDKITDLRNQDLRYALEQVNSERDEIMEQIRALQVGEWYLNNEKLAQMQGLNTQRQEKEDKIKRLEESIEEGI
ncbi:hypothetical protein KY346_05850 [Candidatus Woesearchaeota archaeon]|nr:hypothetical protein [Candidatus Woesearchaeota archaeon]